MRELEEVLAIFVAAVMLAAAARRARRGAAPVHIRA